MTANVVTTYTTGSIGPFVYAQLALVPGTSDSVQIDVFLDGQIQTDGVQYRLDENQKALYFNYPAPTSGKELQIRRVLETARTYTYEPGQALQAYQLNANYDHLRLLVQDMVDYGDKPLPTRQATNLYELRDVDQSVIPQDGDSFTYSAAKGKWQATPFVLSLAGLSDVDFNPATPLDNQLMYWNASNAEWKNTDGQDFRPTEQPQVWGSSTAGIGFLGRPVVDATALTERAPYANEIPTVRDVEEMVDAVLDLTGTGIKKRVDDALALLDGTPMESALLSAVEWKYGIRFANWREYEIMTRDWPNLSGPVQYGDTLPDGSDAIIRTTSSSTVTTSSGPSFIKNPSKRFLPAKMQGRTVGAFSLDPGIYVMYPNLSGNVNTDSSWVTNWGGLIEGINVNGFRVNTENDHVLQVTIEMATAQSSPALAVLTNEYGLLPQISDYAGYMGFPGVYNLYATAFTMNIPTAWFLTATNREYRPLNFRVYGDRNIAATVNTTQNTSDTPDA